MKASPRLRGIAAGDRDPAGACRRGIPAGALRRARRELSLHSRPARLGEDLHRRAPDRRSARAQQAVGDHGEQPQGDPQPARRGGEGRSRARRAVRGRKKARQGRRDTYYPARTSSTSTSRLRTTTRSLRGYGVGVRARGDGSAARLSVHRRGGPSLAPHAIAVMTSARNVVLLGDPLQLAQVTHTQHPGDVGASVLEHLLDRRAAPGRAPIAASC